MKNKNLIPFKETAIIALGEAVVSALVIALFALFELLGFTLLGTFDYTVPLGALLGSLVVVLNFLFLSISTNNTIDKIMAERPEGEMDDEQAAKFAKGELLELYESVYQAGCNIRSGVWTPSAALKTITAQLFFKKK